MKFNFGKMERIGEGGEKTVYNHPEDSEKVVADFQQLEKYQETEPRLKGRYYLTKILHLLFPKNIPDIHFAGKDKNGVQMIFEKKDLDEDNKYLQKMYLERRSGFTSELMYQTDRMHEDPKYKDLDKALADAGLGGVPNPSATNLGFDSEGNLVCIDNDFEPWRWSPFDKELQLNFNREKLIAAIGNLKEEEKEMAMNDLKRIDVLYEEESEKLKKNPDLYKKIAYM